MNCRQSGSFTIWICFKDSLNWTNSFRINLNLISNEKADQALDWFCKTTEKDDEIPFDLSYLTEPNYSNANEEYDLSEILS